MNASDPQDEHRRTQGSNFLRGIIERDLAHGVYAQRHFGGGPGDAMHHAAGPLDPARIRTRFPPEPNGYLHIGHAKSIFLNFGLAREYGGVCHLRFDDTNPEREAQEYVDSILESVRWLGFRWESGGRSHLYHASDYFHFMYRAAEYLVESGHAYVDEQSAGEMRANRGDFSQPGKRSLFRARAPGENLVRLREMRGGLHADAVMVLRAKIDMAHPNINMRDPALYRIKHAAHHNAGDAWCIYPMYTFAHPIEDALENITHSICTLEFEDQRPFYDWLLERLVEGGLLQAPCPKQYEFARLNVTHVVTSKRKLKQLVDESIVTGWDDPRMPTIVGLRRRGYTAEALQLFTDRTGVSKAGGWIDYRSLEIALRDDLDPKAVRAMAVFDPVKLVLTNVDTIDTCSAPVHPAQPERGTRSFGFSREIWIERDDFMEAPVKGYRRLYPGNMVRLKYGHVVRCTGCAKDSSGRVSEVHAELVPDTKSGTPGSDTVKVKGVISWVSVHDSLRAEVRLYDHLFTAEQPDTGDTDFKAGLNPNSMQLVCAYVEPSLAQAKPEQRFQFERHGYFVADRYDHCPGRLVFNRITTLKEGWGQ